MLHFIAFQRNHTSSNTFFVLGCGHLWPPGLLITSPISFAFCILYVLLNIIIIVSDVEIKF